MKLVIVFGHLTIVDATEKTIFNDKNKDETSNGINNYITLLNQSSHWNKLKLKHEEFYFFHPRLCLLCLKVDNNNTYIVKIYIN